MLGIYGILLIKVIMMFEKYNLVHFEVTRPIRHNLDAPYEQSVRLTDADDPNSFPPASMDTVSLGNARYCITGSFDYLLPSIKKNVSEQVPQGQLYLQSFCVMNSDPNYYTHRENYESLLFSYTFSGSGTLLYGGKTQTLSAGNGFIIDCRAPHEYQTASDHWEHVDIHLWGVQAESLYRCAQEIELTFFSYSPGDMMRLIEDLLDAYTNHTKLQKLYVGNALSTLLCAVFRKAEKEGSSSIPPTYRRMIRYMESNYMHSLSLDALSEQFHVSKYHLSREFKKCTGYAPGEYLIMLRLQHASILLAQSDLSIEAIAAQSGFSNMSNFIGQIKKRTGMTPSEFRKKARNS